MIKVISSQSFQSFSQVAINFWISGSISKAALCLMFLMCTNPAFFRRTLTLLWKEPSDSQKKFSDLQRNSSQTHIRKNVLNVSILFLMHTIALQYCLWWRQNFLCATDLHRYLKAWEEISSLKLTSCFHGHLQLFLVVILPLYFSFRKTFEWIIKPCQICRQYMVKLLTRASNTGEHTLLWSPTINVLSFLSTGGVREGNPPTYMCMQALNHIDLLHSHLYQHVQCWYTVPPDWNWDGRSGRMNCSVIGFVY